MCRWNSRFLYNFCLFFKFRSYLGMGLLAPIDHFNYLMFFGAFEVLWALLACLFLPCGRGKLRRHIICLLYISRLAHSMLWGPGPRWCLTPLPVNRSPHGSMLQELMITAV